MVIVSVVFLRNWSFLFIGSIWISFISQEVRCFPYGSFRESAGNFDFENIKTNSFFPFLWQKYQNNCIFLGKKTLSSVKLFWLITIKTILSLINMSLTYFKLLFILIYLKKISKFFFYDNLFFFFKIYDFSSIYIVLKNTFLPIKTNVNTHYTSKKKFLF